jgi:hypothetical protein
MSTDLGRIPEVSGLYVVCVDGDDLPIDRDPRRIATCLRIGRENCKFGRAKNLRRRCSNYLKVFAGCKVTFKVIATLADISSAERACARSLAAYRMRKPETGRLHEWLESTSPAEVERIVRDTLTLGPRAWTIELQQKPYYANISPRRRR